MSDLHALTDAQVVLLAAQFISDVDVKQLQVLAAQRKDVLTRQLIYRLLLALYPTDDTARSALLALLKNVHNDFADVSHLDHQVDTSVLSKLPQNIVTRRAEHLGLPKLLTRDGDDPNAFLDEFLVSWIHQIESTDGSLLESLPLIDTFASDLPSLQQWYWTYLVPIIKLQYEYYPDVPDVIGIQELESMSGMSAVKALLQYAQHKSPHAQIARDLEEVVTPWIVGASGTKRRRLDDGSFHAVTASWSDVNEWILSTSQKDFQLAAKALLEWDGPPVRQHGTSLEDDTSGQADYAQVGFAVIFSVSEVSEEISRTSKQILRRVANMSGLQPPGHFADEAVADRADHPKDPASEADLFFNSLLKNTNGLTRVSQESLAFLTEVLETADILRGYKILQTANEVARVCLSGSEERQKQEVRRVLQQIPRLTTAAPHWKIVRHQLLWLQSWRQIPGQGKENEDSPPVSVAYLSHVPTEYLETEILNSILAGGQYEDVNELYIKQQPTPLHLDEVETRISSAIYSAYDNASNGNKTRGGMKKAHELLTTFRPMFPNSERFRDLDHLIRATHSLSFYPLTLQHGVPFQPVNIRAHKDPLSLLGKVLEQDPRAYTKLDDLLEIGRNLVLARLPTASLNPREMDDPKAELFEAEHRITYLAITSALSAHDFDTAYSYITTRLSVAPTQVSTSEFVDDTSWRAAYAAGKYRPNTFPKSLHVQIASLSKRMDLLSLALALAPSPEPLSEILGTWRRCEEEMDNMKKQALEEERTFEASSGAVPGGFGLDDREIDAVETKEAMARRSLAGNSATYEEEAPMGLFDVAKGAASALRKSAFPLRGGSTDAFRVRQTPSRQSSAASGLIDPAAGDAGGRVRKRDMVSNMVTGGLVSGMSWVLGAPPAHEEEQGEAKTP